jgi:hypothetical protein
MRVRHVLLVSLVGMVVVLGACLRERGAGPKGAGPALVASDEQPGSEASGTPDRVQPVNRAAPVQTIAGPAVDAAGYTTFTPSPESRVVYVSSSGGNDANNGSSPETPVATLVRGAALVRDGEYDFLLLKRGDVWRNQTLGRFKSGKSFKQPLVLSYYGDDEKRPRVEVFGYLINHNGAQVRNVAVIGLQIVAYQKVKGDAAFTGSGNGGLRYVGGGSGHLIEDCHFLHSEMVVQSWSPSGGHAPPYQNIKFRNNIVERVYHVDTCNQKSTHRPSGMYTHHVEGLLIENNLFDHNGWNSEQVESACRSMFNHNLYIHGNDVVLRGNVISRASSIGVKFRSDYTDGAQRIRFENNFFVGGEIGIEMSGNKPQNARRFSDVEILDNVFSQIGMTTERKLSWGIKLQDTARVNISQNLFLEQPYTGNSYGIDIQGNTNDQLTVSENIFFNLRGNGLKVRDGYSKLEVRKNTFYDPGQHSCLIAHGNPDFSQVRYTQNRYYSSEGKDWLCHDRKRFPVASWANTSGEQGAQVFAGDFVDANRTIEDYADSLGISGGLQGFIDVARLRSKQNQDPRLSAAAINEYIRAGFAEK